eukprot:c34607_g1_i1 orf=426-623(+)
MGGMKLLLPCNATHYISVVPSLYGEYSWDLSTTVAYKFFFLRVSWTLGGVEVLFLHGRIGPLCQW